MQFDATWLNAAVGVVLSAFFSYAPEGWRSWFDAQAGNVKRLIFVGVGLLVGLFTVGVSCAGWYELVVCSDTGIKDVVFQLFVFLGASTAMYTTSKLSAK